MQPIQWSFKSADKYWNLYLSDSELWVAEDDYGLEGRRHYGSKDGLSVVVI